MVVNDATMALFNMLNTISAKAQIAHIVHSPTCVLKRREFMKLINNFNEIFRWTVLVTAQGL